jgi:hypothetical protein
MRLDITLIYLPTTFTIPGLPRALLPRFLFLLHLLSFASLATLLAHGRSRAFSHFVDCQSIVINHLISKHMRKFHSIIVRNVQ